MAWSLVRAIFALLRQIRSSCFPAPIYLRDSIFFNDIPVLADEHFSAWATGCSITTARFAGHGGACCSARIWLVTTDLRRGIDCFLRSASTPESFPRQRKCALSVCD